MKVLVLGVDGMIGHKITQSLIKDFDLFVTTRRKSINFNIGLNKEQIIFHDFLVDNTDELFSNISPDIIVNCIGITTRRATNISEKNIDLLNSKLPHYLDNLSKKTNSKLIHFSTDCVFNGETGNYSDESLPDAKDLYGISKAKGEINNSSSLTIRSSMIGRELFNFTELFEWLYSMRGKKIEGYSNVIYSGITTVRMGKIINSIIKNQPTLSGILNVSSNPISKFQLLKKLSQAFDLKLDIRENSNISSNKVLNSKKFTEITGIKTPSWDDLIPEFWQDSITNQSLYKK